MVKRLFQFLLLLILTQGLAAQKPIVKGWHLLDRTVDGYNGISLAQAYHFLQNKPSQTVLVAIIDSGIDTTHESLKSVIWHNPLDTSANGIDEDKNGYADDLMGWNFLGNSKGENVEKESSEVARLFNKLQPRFETTSVDTVQMNAEEKSDYRLWLQVKKAAEVSPEDIFLIKIMQATLKHLSGYDSILAKQLGKKEFNSIDLEKFIPQDNEAKKAKLNYLKIYNLLQIDAETTNVEFMQEVNDFIASKEDLIHLREKPATNFRYKITGDNDEDWHTRDFGNNDIMGKSSLHGTHVAGIIGAQKQNDSATHGVAQNVRLLTIRAVPVGDEHDKDIALGIRYAVDMGARVINMSFGKSLSPQKKWVDEAIQYAARHNVLLVNAAGNDNQNTDSIQDYPSPYFLDGTKAVNMITVGASTDSSIKPGLLADFTNYGHETVDVLAPGVKIYSTIPTGDNYGYLQGTSMAAPIVSGLAALLFSYYPQLTAVQVKAIIEQSADSSFANQLHSKPGTEGKEKISLLQACKTGGIVNAYNAVKLAAEWTKK